MNFYELVDMMDNLGNFEEKHVEKRVVSKDEYDDGDELNELLKHIEFEDKPE